VGFLLIPLKPPRFLRALPLRFATRRGLECFVGIRQVYHSGNTRRGVEDARS
jgi:hypothetical protein